MFDGKQFGIEIVAVVKGHIERSLAPLNARLDAFEKMIAALPVPKDGKDADVEAIAQEVTADVMAALTALLPDNVSKIQVEHMISSALADLPPAAAGKDADPDMIKQMVADAVAALPPAEKGKDADPVEVAAQIAQEVERAVAAIPAPKDGQSVTLDDVCPLIDEAVTKAVTLIPVPKDGADGKDGRDGLDVVKFIRDDRGHLNGILRDGTTVDLGEYVGKNGEPGVNGKDGDDGVGFDDMDLVETEQGVVLRFTRGDVVKDFRLPIVTDRGVFKEGTEYHKGDGVTWGGSFWIAQETTSDKPDSGKGFRLAIKKGRDGKDGIMKPAPKSGPVKVG